MNAEQGKSTKDWRCIMNKRIGLSYRSCSFGLVWLDDKLEQVNYEMKVSMSLC